MVKLIAWHFGTGSSPLNHSGRCPLTSLNEYGESGPCLGTVWADTENPVYQIEINESTANRFTSEATLLPLSARFPRCFSALKTTGGQIDGLFGQFSFKCYLAEVAPVGVDLRFAPGLPPGWVWVGS